MRSSTTEPQVSPPFVTADSIDPLFGDPFIDIDEQRLEPIPHRYVNGGFQGSGARFSFYFPPSNQYRGRFFQNTYPLASSENVGPVPIPFDIATGDIGFTLASGAYYVQSNNGGAFRSAGKGEPSSDPSVASYRANAAAAKYSRVVAERIFGPHRTYGYLFGGSGGAYQTIAAAEHTSGIWDGFLPFVMGCNNAVPNLWTVRLQVLRVLRRRNKLAGVFDALSPGGSGDIYAGLNEEEAEVLREATRMGFPLRGWYAHETLGSGYFSNSIGVVPAFDPTYVEDFWTKPGYRGADPSASVQLDRFKFDTTLARIDPSSPLQLTLADVPGQDFSDTHLVLLAGPHAGKTLPISYIEGNEIGFASSIDVSVLDDARPGDAVRIDNSWPLAMETFQRHQVPPDAAEYVWDQFRDPAGTPLYPQRPILVGCEVTKIAASALLTGAISGKMLLMAGLMDIDALAWSADWFRSMVKRATGPAFDDAFALWFIDRAEHDNPQTPLARANAVPLTGPLEQGLRDLSRWVEQGVKPLETRYKVTDGQIEVPQGVERGGIQPLIALTVNGGARADIAVGEQVLFAARVEVPEGTGNIVAAEWDFEATGSYEADRQLTTPQPLVELTASHAYQTAGTYYAVLRCTNQREGDAATRYARVQNLAQVRVVVR